MDSGLVAFLLPDHLRPAVQTGQRNPRLALGDKAAIWQPFGVDLVSLLQRDAVGVHPQAAGGQLVGLLLRAHQIELQQQVVPLAHAVQLTQPVPLGPLVGLLYHHHRCGGSAHASEIADHPLYTGGQSLVIDCPQYHRQAKYCRRQTPGRDAPPGGPLFRRRQGVLYQGGAGTGPVKEVPIGLFRHSSSAPFHASRSSARPRASWLRTVFGLRPRMTAISPVS